MATGIEIFGLVGSISATIDIIARVVDVIGAAQDQEQAERDLRMRFEADLAALRALLVVHQNNKALTSPTLSDEDEKLLDDISVHLGTLRSTLEARINKLYSPPESDATLTSGAASTRPVTSRISWVLWRRRDLQRLEASLCGWIRRLEVVYSALGVPGWPPKVIASTTGAAADFSGQHTVNRISLKIDDYGALAARMVDEEVLFKPVQRIKFLSNHSRRNIACYSAGMGLIETNGVEEPPQPVVVEYTAQSYNENDSEAVRHIESATRNLAKMLFHSDPDRTGLLRCMGYTHNETLRSFGLLYELPPSARSTIATNKGCTGVDGTNTTWELRSLRDLYQHRPSFSLTERVTLCCDIAKAVLYVHLLGWVHKSLRPDNILFFSNPAAAGTAVESSSETTARLGADHGESYNSVISRPAQRALPQCYLAGFEYARSTKAMSDRRSDGDWKQNVYRHPRRQGIASNSEYTMAHDIYSLGVVCLEVGMWGRDGACRVPYGDRSRFQKLGPAAVTTELVRILDGRPATGSGRDDGGLAAFMGDTFAAVVRFCLTIGAADDVPSARYIQEVWLKLDELRCAL